MPKKLVNYDLVEMTADEIADSESVHADIEAKEEARVAAKEKKSIDKASGNQKLKDLGLTDDEIAALTN